MKKLRPYLLGILSLVGISFLSTRINSFISALPHNTEHDLLVAFFVISILFVMSFLIFYISTGTPIPAFVVAIFFGFAAHDMLQPLLAHTALVQIIVGLGATLILFGGGLEIPFRNFKKIIWAVFSLAFLGLLFTAAAFSGFLYNASVIFDINISATVALLLGAVLASTDPAAIIPTLKNLRFHRSEIKDIIVSETALTDVTGTLLAVTFLAFIGADGMQSLSLRQAYMGLFSPDSIFSLISHLVIGVLCGLLGYGFLYFLGRFKKRHMREFEVDSAFFLFIPIFIFTIAILFGGSGYLAAFIAGLLFNMIKNLSTTERFFNHIIDGFFKPTIFILLGAMVELQAMIDYAAIGIVSALVFMLIIRPLSVFLSLGPFLTLKSFRLNLRDLLFISWIRETGAIPAVLLISIGAGSVVGMESLVPVGTWIILLTLLIQPMLTPLVAKKLGIADCIRDDHAAPSISLHDQQVVVLATRGDSFLRRIPKVTEWATLHGISTVVILVCLEDRYSEEKVSEIAAQTHQAFEEINKKFEQEEKPEIQFSLLSRKGFLQKNLKELALSQNNISAFFVGKRMLDYKLEEIKQMNVPFYFMD